MPGTLFVASSGNLYQPLSPLHIVTRVAQQARRPKPSSAKAQTQTPTGKVWAALPHMAGQSIAKVHRRAISL
jgi:hypothetical protein